MCIRTPISIAKFHQEHLSVQAGGWRGPGRVPVGARVELSLTQNPEKVQLRSTRLFRPIFT